MKYFSIVMQIGVVLFVSAELRSEDFIRQSGSMLVRGENSQLFYLRGINFGSYFMIDCEVNGECPRDAEWYTEGFEKPFPSPDDDIPVVLLFDWLSEEHFSVAARTGFNTARIVLTYRVFEDNGKPGVYKKAGWDLLDKYIAWAKKHNVYLVLNFSVPQGGYQPGGGGKNLWKKLELQIRFRKLWKEIAQRYANEPSIAAYDLIGEPHPTSSATDSVGDNIQWKTLAQQLVDDIRSVDQNHLIDVEAVNWVDDGTISDWSLEVLDSFQFLVNDSNVMYDTHFYFPFDYVFRASPSTYPSSQKVRTIDGKMMPFDRNYLEHEIKILTRFADSNNFPMYFGEWSEAAIFRNGGIDYDRNLLDLFDQYHVHWTFFSIHQLYNGEMMEKNLNEDRIRLFEEYFKAPSSPK